MNLEILRKLRWGISIVLLPTFFYWIFRMFILKELIGHPFACSSQLQTGFFISFLCSYLVIAVSWVPDYFAYCLQLWEAGMNYDQVMKMTEEVGRPRFNPRLAYGRWWGAALAIIALLILTDILACRIF